jgi:Anti-sigma-D factor RsdA to sigma factor binding region
MSDHDPGLDAIMRTDRFVDALASGARMSSVDPLSSMLGAWRDDVRDRPEAQVVTLAQASAALGVIPKRPRRNRIGLSVAGAVAASVLFVGGFGTVIYQAAPGDALYGLRAMLFGESAKTRDDAVVLAAQTELEQVQQLVQQGKWDQAQDQLVTLGPTVQSVNDVQSKQQLVQTYNALTAKVIQRDPEAAPPAPGEPPPPVNPSSPLTFLPVPVITPSTAPPPSVPDLSTTTAPTSLPVSSLPTPASPLPTESVRTPVSPLPTETLPSRTVPTPISPLPTETLPTRTVPTPISPLPTETLPTRTVPTPTSPLPTETLPTPTRQTETAPPPVVRSTEPRLAPTAPVTVTTPPVQLPPSLPPTVPGPRPLPQITRAPALPRGPIVVTTPVPVPQGPPGH